MSIFMYNVQCTVTQWPLKAKGPPPTGSRSTFEFPSRVNLYGPSFTVSPGHWVNKAECRHSIVNRTSRCNKVDAVRLYVEFTLLYWKLLYPLSKINLSIRFIFYLFVYICLYVHLYLGMSVMSVSLYIFISVL